MKNNPDLAGYDNIRNWRINGNTVKWRKGRNGDMLTEYNGETLRTDGSTVEFHPHYQVTIGEYRGSFNGRNITIKYIADLTTKHSDEVLSDRRLALAVTADKGQETRYYIERVCKHCDMPFSVDRVEKELFELTDRKITKIPSRANPGNCPHRRQDNNYFTVVYGTCHRCMGKALSIKNLT